MRERLAGSNAPAWGFFVGLPSVSGLVGFILGEVWLGRGNGRYVGPTFALIGLILAAMLWRTRPKHTEEEIAAAVAEREERAAVVGKASQTREEQAGGARVRVTKSARTDKRKG